MDVEMSMMSNGYPASVASSRRHGTHRASRSRTISRNVRRLQEAVNLHLNNYEKELFLDALNEYHSQKDAWEFVELLRTILTTPAKQQLVPMIRQVLSPPDIAEFDQCVQLSSAAARGDRGAGRITAGAASAAHASRSNSRKYNTAPMRLKKRSHSSSSDHHRKGPADLNIIQIVPDADGLGFTIKSSHRGSGRPGVFVSAVDPRSNAYNQGLAVGDEILEANDIDLSKTTNQDAALILQAARSLTLTVKHSSKHDTLAIRQETYTWVDTEGRSCTPPPSDTDIHNTLRSSVSKRSGMTLISSQDERKINLRIERGHGLGLTIRGGSEYGLGIYITGVDHDSSAKRSGIRVGDQILAVNDVQFVEITHAEAVKELKKSRHMMLTLKHVGKLPHAKIDKMKLLTSERAHSTTGRRSRSHSRRHRSSSVEDLHKDHRSRYPGSLDRKKYHESEQQKSAFTKGAGSQLMLAHNTMMSSHNYTLVDEQARNLLNDNERGTLKFYIDEYNKGYVSVDALAAALKELFNTHAKFQMFHELRSLIRPRDLSKYDNLVVKYEVSSLKIRLDQSQDQMSDFSLDSILSVPSNSSTNESLSPSLSNQIKQRPPTSHSNASTLIQNGTGSVRSNKMFMTDGSNQTVVTDPQSVGSLRRRPPVTSAEINHFSSGENSPRDNGKNVPRMGMRAAKISPKQDGRSPSNDSGVDVRAKAGGTSQSGSSYTDTMTRPKISPPSPPTESHSSHSSSDGSSLEAVKEHYRQSYSLSGSLKHADQDSNGEDSEDDHIPGLHTDLDATDSGNVVLVGSKDVGTLPRRQLKPSDGRYSEATGLEVAPSPSTSTFAEQVKSRSVLTGKMYLPPPTSQRHEIPMSDSDYDSADIIRISKELYASSLTDERKGDKSEQSMSSTQQSVTDRRDSLPPPPEHLLHDSAESSKVSTAERDDKGQNHHTGHRQIHSDHQEGQGQQLFEVNGGSQAEGALDQLNGVLHVEDERENIKAVQEVVNAEVTNEHPALQQGRSPKTGKKSSPGKSDKTSSSIYAVIKKQSPKQARPSMTFDPPPPVIDSPTTPTVPSRPAVSKKKSDTVDLDTLPSVRETLATKEARPLSSDYATIDDMRPSGNVSADGHVVRVNKLRPTLGLAIEGGAGTKQPIPRIINIQETGCAHQSGLMIGQLILRINDKYLDGLSHNQAARIIADAFRDRKTGYLDFLVKT